MKTRIFFVIAAVLVFGLGMASFGYKQTSNTIAKAASSCCKGDSCPMKGKASATAVAAAHEDCDCCKDGVESCPMRKAAAAATAVKSDDAESCPMKMAAAAVKVKHAKMKQTADGSHESDCCCCCCKKDKEKVETAAV